MKVLSLLILLLLNFQHPDKDKYHTYVLTAKNLLKKYPEARLTDIYKYFHQGRFGPEHLIIDSLIALEFLKSEVNSLVDKNSDSVLIEYLQPENKYVRVDLLLVKRKIISIDFLFSTFYQSASVPDSLEIERWKIDWNHICEEIEKNKLPIKDFTIDKNKINSSINQNKIVFSHSYAYKKNYKPAYRVVDRKIFEKFILPEIKNQKVKIIK